MGVFGTGILDNDNAWEFLSFVEKQKELALAGIISQRDLEACLMNLAHYIIAKESRDACGDYSERAGDIRLASIYILMEKGWYIPVDLRDECLREISGRKAYIADSYPRDMYYLNLLDLEIKLLEYDNMTPVEFNNVSFAKAFGELMPDISLLETVKIFGNGETDEVLKIEFSNNHVKVFAHSDPDIVVFYPIVDLLDIFAKENELKLLRI